MTALTGKTIMLGITGGIAAYKSAELVRLLVKAGAQVQVVMTDAATRFVTPLTFQALSGNPVWTELWNPQSANGMAHINLSRTADLALIAPASANFIARLAQGHANDLLSTLCLARDCPLLVAPAMNLQMWGNPATQRNVAQLAADGIGLLGPASGSQACGEVGEGRMLEAEELFEHLLAHFQPKLLAGRRVLMTAGPTFEALDPVRGLTNLSSGKMGFALARACVQAGAHVTLVSGPVSLPTPQGVTRIDVQSASQMHDAVFGALPGQDVFIGVAAVADYRPSQAAADKIKKSADTLTLELLRNPDILAAVAAQPDAPLCVGFAAESRNLDGYAQGKLQAKKLQLVVGNLVQDSIGRDSNAVVLYDAAGRHPLPPASKDDVAQRIVSHLAGLLK
ncbi:bifunctional phosphopantothenoylcysteine decarboxylase/phosphopantothenate--cysteine ligase CoaBC [Uliginosibacterium sediminicola]|uniref:Coenzyme A biosynthesis bifunctional protein CoaBC n=1 Tax=Uliginosibacterium sediminicola TaxID=2024550 RepID=A0ABU9Z3V7_9RHOO